MGSSYGIRFKCCCIYTQNNTDDNNSGYENVSHCVHIKARTLFKRKHPISQSRHRYNNQLMIINQKKLVERRAKRRDRHIKGSFQPSISGRIWYEQGGKIKQIVPVDKHLYTILSDNGSSSSNDPISVNSSRSSREETLTCEIPPIPDAHTSPSACCALDTDDTEQVTISDRRISFEQTEMVTDAEPN